MTMLHLPQKHEPGPIEFIPQLHKKRQTARLRHAHLRKPYQITHKAFPTPAEKGQAGETLRKFMPRHRFLPL
jgi:hypothetical protein